jgi:NTP pyrophosphatase (non-canonical NTP hydrolase)
MKKDTTEIISDILAELRRAEIKYPDWPTDQIHAAAIVAEESGELVRAVLNESYHGTSQADSDREAVQTAAMCIRFLVNRSGI